MTVLGAGRAPRGGNTQQKSLNGPSRSANSAAAQKDRRLDDAEAAASGSTIRQRKAALQKRPKITYDEVAADLIHICDIPAAIADVRTLANGSMSFAMHTAEQYDYESMDAARVTRRGFVMVRVYHLPREVVMDDEDDAGDVFVGGGIPDWVEG